MLCVEVEVGLFVFVVSISLKFFYDVFGLCLFEVIIDLFEYYLMCIEVVIFSLYVVEIVF